MDCEGMVTKTGPDGLVMGLLETMQKYGVKFETVEIE
jgi:hypothetical protein